MSGVETGEPEMSSPSISSRTDLTVFGSRLTVCVCVCAADRNVERIWERVPHLSTILARRIVLAGDGDLCVCVCGELYNG